MTQKTPKALQKMIERNGEISTGVYTHDLNLAREILGMNSPWRSWADIIKQELNRRMGK